MRVLAHSHRPHRVTGPQGLCLSCQLLPVGEIPMAAHDVRVDAVAHPGGVIVCAH